MTRSGNTPRLAQHIAEPYVEVHPDDTRRFGVIDGRLACVRIAYAATAERDHPIVNLWGPKSRQALRQLFDCRPNISLHALMAALDAERVVFTHTPTDPFFNINSPQDLETAERIAASAGRD